MRNCGVVAVEVVKEKMTKAIKRGNRMRNCGEVEVKVTEKKVTKDI